MFVPGKPFQLSLLVVGKTRSLPKSGAFERFFNREGSCFSNTYQTRLKGMPGANTLAFLRKFKTYGRKKFYNIGPWSFRNLGLNKGFRRQKTFFKWPKKLFFDFQVFVGTADQCPVSRDLMMTHIHSQEMPWGVILKITSVSLHNNHCLNKHRRAEINWYFINTFTVASQKDEK